MHDESEIRRALAILAPAGVFEIRAPKTRQNSRYEATTAGYFDNPDDAVKAVAKLAGRAPGIYITLNPVDPALLARSANRLDPRAKHTTNDAEIIARYWLLLDFDPVRPAGISSSDAEHQAALERALVVCGWLMNSQGWPAPVYADSGNGAHLLYRIDLPNDADSKALVEAVLKSLANRFDDDRVKLDTGVGNAARITKLYGTQARKGDPLPDRPYRISRILESPETPSPVDLEHLRALVLPPAAAAAPSRPASCTPAPPSGYFFAQVNAAAMRALSIWVPVLFPAATSYHDGYRVSSKDLARDLEEDLSIAPAGIVDFGLADQGDPASGKRTPIDLVIEHGRQPDAKAAARWLCAALSIDPAQLGWREPKPDTISSSQHGESTSRARAYEKVSSNPSSSSSSAESGGYSVILENKPVILSKINKICLESGKGGELPADSIAAERIAAALKGSLGFNRDAMTWHIFMKTHWQPVAASVVEELVTQVLYDAVPGGFELRYLTAILKLLVKGLLPLPQRDAKAAGWIPFENGILEPATRTLHRVTPENAMTWCLPYPYDPAATCPTISKWLLTAVDGDEKTQEFLRAWLAAVLEGRPDLQKFLHILGPGGSGKGTFIRLATKLIGERNQIETNLRQLENNRFETGGIYGKRLVTITDCANYKGQVSVFKALTGQDTIRQERKHKDPGTFIFEGMLILASNENLMVSDYTSGLERRRMTVEFNRVATTDERAAWDAQGGEAMVLHREIPGLVNWILGLSREETTRLIMNPPSRAAESNLEALRFGNPVADWLMESILPKPDHKARVGDKRQALRNGQVIFYYAEEWLYPNFLTWCARNARKDVSLVRFSSLIIDVAQHLGLQLKKDRDSTGRYIVGLILRKDFEKQHDWTRRQNDGSSKPDDGLNDGLSPDNPLNMLTVTEYDNDSNLLQSAGARSNNNAVNEGNEEVF